jgi:hypothetical protein
MQLLHPSVAVACGFASVTVVFAILYLPWWLLIGRHKPQSGTRAARRTPAEEAEIQEGRLLLIEACLRNPDVRAWIGRGDAQPPLKGRVRERRVASSPERTKEKARALPAGKSTPRGTSGKKKPSLRRNTSFPADFCISREPLSPIDEHRALWQSSPNLAVVAAGMDDSATARAERLHSGCTASRRDVPMPSEPPLTPSEARALRREVAMLQEEAAARESPTAVQGCMSIAIYHGRHGFKCPTNDMVFVVPPRGCRHLLDVDSMSVL